VRPKPAPIIFNAIRALLSIQLSTVSTADKAAIAPPPI
jgi:hypothetical protein